MYRSKAGLLPSFPGRDAVYMITDAGISPATTQKVVYIQLACSHATIPANLHPETRPLVQRDGCRGHAQSWHNALIREIAGELQQKAYRQTELPSF